MVLCIKTIAGQHLQLFFTAPCQPNGPNAILAMAFAFVRQTRSYTAAYARITSFSSTDMTRLLENIQHSSNAFRAVVAQPKLATRTIAPAGISAVGTHP